MNKILEITTFIKDNLYDDELLDDDVFFFNVIFDDNQIPKVGNGSDEDHLHIMMSSKSLMSNIEKTHVHHTDWTYKMGFSSYSNRLDKSHFKLNRNRVFYVGANGNKYLISIEKKCCSCKHFLKYAICPHVIAYSNINQLNWFGDEYNKSEKVDFANKNKRGPKGGRYKKAEKALVKK